MKFRFWDQLIFYCGAVLAMLAGVFLFLLGLQIPGLAGGMPAWAQTLCIVLGLMMAAFGGFIINFPRRYSAKKSEFVVQRTDSGELRIAVKAIENLVQKCIDLHEEIKPLSMEILNGREGVVVDLNVALANNISIPLAVASLQKQIKQYLIASSGVEVKEVRVSVESTQEILPVPEAEETEAEEQAAAPKEKPPLHQRLFGTPDQPAIVPEPPREESAPETSAQDDGEDAAQSAEEAETETDGDAFPNAEAAETPEPAEISAEETDEETLKPDPEPETEEQTHE